jgi:hypothetical protein
MVSSPLTVSSLQYRNSNPSRKVTSLSPGDMITISVWLGASAIFINTSFRSLPSNYYCIVDYLCSDVAVIDRFIKLGY